MTSMNLLRGSLAFAARKRPSLHANCEQSMGLGAMSMKWIFSSMFLLHTGGPNDFRLEESHQLNVFLAGVSQAARSSNAQP
jgi:hypothetical protein